MSVRRPSKPELHSCVPQQEASFIMTIFSLDASLWPLHLWAGLSQSLGAEHVWHLENPNLISLNETINWSSWSNTPSLRFLLPKDIGKLTKKLHKTKGNRRLPCWRRISTNICGGIWSTQVCLGDDASGNAAYSSQSSGEPMLCVPVGKTFLLKAEHPGRSPHAGAWAGAAPLGSAPAQWGEVWQSAAQSWNGWPRSWWLTEIKSRPQRDINFRNVGVASAVTKFVS